MCDGTQTGKGVQRGKADFQFLSEFYSPRVSFLSGKASAQLSAAVTALLSLWTEGFVKGRRQACFSRQGKKDMAAAHLAASPKTLPPSAATAHTGGSLELWNAPYLLDFGLSGALFTLCLRKNAGWGDSHFQSH